jgi:hypothetical protein
MTTKITPILWRLLNDSEEREFRMHARQNYVVGTNVDTLFHPVYLHECYLMNKEAGILTKE